MDQLYYDTGFGILPKSVMQDINLSLQAKGLFAYLATYSGTNGVAFPSRSLMTYHLGISKDTLTKYMNELKERGYIQVFKSEREQGKFSHNIYKLIPCPKSSDTVKPDTVKPDTKNNSIKNNSIKNNSVKNNSVKNNNNIKKEKETNLDKLIKEYTDNEELKETLKDFIKMRKTIKKPVTDRALKGILNKLDNLSNNNQIKIEILEQSIEKCWVGVFPLKENKKYSTNNISQPTNSIPKQQQFIPHYNLPGENRVGVRVNETFRDYEPGELERMLLESQKGKFD